MLGVWRIVHWGPVTAISIIKCISLVTLYSNLKLYPPTSSLGALAFTLSFLVLSGLTLYHFLFAMYDGPGYLVLGWSPDSLAACQQLQFCHICQGYKAPRSHHCRKCNRCVLKMDHHCPWINNCVGHFNHGHFTAFLASAVSGCILSTVSLSLSLYYGLNRSWYEFYGTGREPKIYFTVWSLVATLLGLGLAIGVVIAVGLLLFFQLRSILRNQTGIEDWIIEKAVFRHRHLDRHFIYPYNVGRLSNISQVITWTCQPKGDGIVWEVAEGTDQYSLTREQLLQKADKRDRSREFEIIRNFSGSCFPLGHGVRVCVHPPCTDEPRIKLDRGDRVVVTRWKKYWLYGDKIVVCKQDRVRGWFPRHCAVEVYCDGIHHHIQEEEGESETQMGLDAQQTHHDTAPKHKSKSDKTGPNSANHKELRHRKSVNNSDTKKKR